MYVLKRGVLIVIMLMMGSGAWSMKSIDQPGPLDAGYGSSENYICSDYSLKKFGSVLSGSYCYIYEPAQLKNGSSAPVILYLHGMVLLAPEIYENHIIHLVKQGYIVIFPQFQQSIVTLMFDMDQNTYLNRAVDAANSALDRIGSKAELNHLSIFGHSLGGLLAISWHSNQDAPAVERLVLANPCFDMSAASGMNSIPGMDWLMDLFISQIDYNQMAAGVTVPVMILSGNDDTIAPFTTAVDGYHALSHAPQKVLYRLETDDHGSDTIMADHMASICDDGWMPSWLMSFFGGDGEVDAADYRYYRVGMDAALDDVYVTDYDMGYWSDGEAVKEVVQVLP